MTKIEIHFTNNMKSHTMYVGFDDTDSPKGMCTTYLAYKMVNLLKKEKVTFLDFPNLIRKAACPSHVTLTGSVFSCNCSSAVFCVSA